MKIGEIAKKAGVTTSKIRFYEKKGIIGQASRDINGYRDYEPALIERLKFIQQAQHLGFTLNEIAKVEPKDKDHPVACEVAIELLQKKMSSINALIAEARQRKKDIKAQINALKKAQT
ncbi:MAG: MerR family transcriptional regulator [Marinicella sp.]